MRNDVEGNAYQIALNNSTGINEAGYQFQRRTIVEKFDV
jgi:hypothetical protein